MQPTDEQAREFDQQDELAPFRERFVIDDPEMIYLDGNSLGRLPKQTLHLLRDVVTNQWGRNLIQSWNTSWFEVSRRIGAKIARLIGAQEHEVIVADSTSLNLYKLALAAMQARPDRHTFVTDELNFPSDIYVLQGLARAHSPLCRLNIVRSRAGQTISPAELVHAIDEQTLMVTLSHTAFQSGFVYDMQAITRLAHGAGAWVLWDLCHSVGAMPIDVRQAGVDLAVGCTYKYLNGGPGAPAFLFVREGLQAQLVNPIWGWFGSRKQFEFSDQYQPADGMQRFQIGTPPILSLCAIEAGVDLVCEAGLERIRAKSVRQTEYVYRLWQKFLKPIGFSWNSPMDSAERGAHVSLSHSEAWRITQALIQQMKVVPDFRIPNNIRLGVSPLYVSFHDLYEAVKRIQSVVVAKAYEQYANEKGSVT